LEDAIARDPGYATALAWAAVCCQALANDSRTQDLETVSRKGLDFARRALEGARDDPGALANAALALAYFGEDISSAVGLVDRALELNPSFARGWHISGILRRWAGQPDIAIEHVERSLRLSPRSRVGWASWAIGSAQFVARRFEDPVPKLLAAIQDDPSSPDAYRHLAACYAQMGRLDNARETIAQLREITPVVVPSVIYYRKPEHRELFLSGLRLAMGEEK
jgi:adenylate cyclase